MSAGPRVRYPLRLLMLVACGLSSVFAETPAVGLSGWQTRLPAFSVDGPPRGEGPILLYFTADWCGFCKQMERTTLAEPEVVAKVSALRAHVLNFDAQGGLVKRFGVRGIPAWVLTNDRGEVFDRLTGANSPDAFLRWLARGEAEFARRALSEEQRAEAVLRLPAELRSNDAAVRARALDMLWIHAGRGEGMERGTAAVQLLELAASEPALWRAGLAHADLAVRVAAVNLWSEHSDRKLDFDPWAEEATRRAALAALGL
jgi:thiol-disulfide isomerase/thioredoxin